MIFAFVYDRDGTGLAFVGPATNRNEIKRLLRPWKVPGRTAVVVGSLRARTGTLYQVGLSPIAWLRAPDQRQLTGNERERLSTERRRKGVA